jgi:hypothetical protein
LDRRKKPANQTIHPTAVACSVFRVQRLIGRGGIWVWSFSVEGKRCTVPQDEYQQLCANLQAIDRLLKLADGLRRNNAMKWEFSLAEWQAALNDVLSAPTPRLGDDVLESLRAVLSAARRLGNSVEARFGSASVGRDPDSSLAGRRFRDDLEGVHRRLEILHGLRQRRTPS